MLTATNSDGPAFKTRSKTSQPFNTQLNKETVMPDLTTIQSTPDATPKPLMDDRLQVLLQMQKMDPFCKCISK